jgi:hypothetical protein
MKATVLTLPILGLVFGFAAPVNASQNDRLSLSDVTAASQQSKCKEDEVWDAETEKCVKKEG